MTDLPESTIEAAWRAGQADYYGRWDQTTLKVALQTALDEGGVVLATRVAADKAELEHHRVANRILSEKVDGHKQSVKVLNDQLRALREAAQAVDEPIRHAINKFTVGNLTGGDRQALHDLGSAAERLRRELER